MAGARGPLPKLCADCRGAQDRQLHHTLRAAGRLAEGLKQASLARQIRIMAADAGVAVARRHDARFPGE